MKIGICGIAGRMGRTILNIMLNRGHELATGIEAAGSIFVGKDAGELIAKKLNVKIVSIDDLNNVDAQCIIDFSSPEATLSLIDFAMDKKIPLVIGTTGFTNEQKSKIEEASKSIPIVFSPNMSVGVNLLFRLTEIASKVLGEGFDVEIFEAHHRMKKDAPSGTANKLIEIIKNNKSDLNDAPVIYGREGLIGERPSKQIGVMVMRGGDIVGEHTVYYIANGERIELTHKATSRETFARGSVLAAEFLADKQNGLYSMFDVLGL